MTKGSDLLVAALENEGVECIFAIPGEENLDVLESLRRSRIKLVLTRHEQAAGFMAATYGRLTGRAGVCLTTLGPGALNLSTSPRLMRSEGTPDSSARMRVASCSADISSEKKPTTAPSSVTVLPSSPRPVR